MDNAEKYRRINRMTPTAYNTKLGDMIGRLNDAFSNEDGDTPIKIIEMAIDKIISDGTQSRYASIGELAEQVEATSTYSTQPTTVGTWCDDIVRKKVFKVKFADMSEYEYDEVIADGSVCPNAMPNNYYVLNAACLLTTDVDYPSAIDDRELQRDYSNAGFFFKMPNDYDVAYEELEENEGVVGWVEYVEFGP